MNHIGKSYKYTDEVMSKRALEVVDQELIDLYEWAQDNSATSGDILDRITHQQGVYADLIEEKFYSIEQLRRDADNHQHQLASPKGIHITDHAVVRYLQRVMGVDLKEMAKSIVPESAEGVIKSVKSGRVILGDTIIVFKNSVVVTILDRNTARKYRMKTIDLRSKVKRKKKRPRTKRRRV